jgi:hypothetical protein
VAPQSRTYLLACSFTQDLTHSPTHLLMHPLTHSPSLPLALSHAGSPSPSSPQLLPQVAHLSSALAAAGRQVEAGGAIQAERDRLQAGVDVLSRQNAQLLSLLKQHQVGSQGSSAFVGQVDLALLTGDEIGIISQSSVGGSPLILNYVLPRSCGAAAAGWWWGGRRRHAMVGAFVLCGMYCKSLSLVDVNFLEAVDLKLTLLRPP